MPSAAETEHVATRHAQQDSLKFKDESLCCWELIANIELSLFFRLTFTASLRKKLKFITPRTNKFWMMFLIVEKSK